MSLLSKELFDTSRDAYVGAAESLLYPETEADQPPPPRAAADEFALLLERIGDERTVETYASSLVSDGTIAYRLILSETWEDLDISHARSLVDSGLLSVRQEHLETGVSDPLEVSDPWCRIHYTTLGLAISHPAFADLCDYLFSRAAFQRLGILEDIFLRSGFTVARVKRRHAEKFGQTQYLAWKIGQGLGLLTAIGEIAPPSDGE
jgi:hypothetical protein